MTDVRNSGRQAIDSLRNNGLLDALPDLAQRSSNLSADEELALAQVGYEPVAIVTGAGVARLGYNGKNSLRPFRNYQVPSVSRLMTRARGRAVADMANMCERVGGTGVIGASLSLHGAEKAGLATFVAAGTAIRPLAPTGRTSAAPFTSSLSGRDFHLLVRQGCMPLGLVVGSSCYHFGWRSLPRWLSSQGRCIELTTLTQSLYAARELALRAVQDHAADLGADGVIGIQVLERPKVWGRHVIEFVAFGTAIAYGQEPPDADPEMFVMLDAALATARPNTFVPTDGELTSLR